MSEVRLRIENMHCGSCVRRVAQALNGIEGVIVEEVRVGAARFSADEPVPVAAAQAALAALGFLSTVEQ